MAPVYTSQTDYEAYVEGWVTDNASALLRLLERAERDVDRFLAGERGTGPNGLRVTPSELETWQRQALSRAVCAQAEARWRTDYPQDGDPPADAKRVRGPDFEVEFWPGANPGPFGSGGAPLVDAAVAELSGTGLLATVRLH
jgi:hypothetical protein